MPGNLESPDSLGHHEPEQVTHALFCHKCFLMASAFALFENFTARQHAPAGILRIL